MSLWKGQVKTVHWQKASTVFLSFNNQQDLLAFAILDSGTKARHFSGANIYFLREGAVLVYDHGPNHSKKQTDMQTKKNPKQNLTVPAVKTYTFILVLEDFANTKQL